MRPDPIQTAKQAVDRHYPGALGAFVSGSVVRGEATDTSDIDVAVLFDDTYEDVHRNSATEDGWPIEFFVHNPQAQDYFFDRDRRRGMCVMPSIVGTGIMIPASCPALVVQRDKALAIIEAGPPPLSPDEIQLRRYTISDVLDDIRGACRPAIRNAMLSLLHDRLGDFHLRAGGHWSGFGKALLRCLKAADETYAGRFERAFEDAFSGDSLGQVLELSQDTLEPYGGYLRDGYRASAQPDWKNFERLDP